MPRPRRVAARPPAAPPPAAHRGAGRSKRPGQRPARPAKPRGTSPCRFVSATDAVHPQGGRQRENRASVILRIELVAGKLPGRRPAPAKGRSPGALRDTEEVQNEREFNGGSAQRRGGNGQVGTGA
ncbi:Exonuclease SbcC [Rhodovastum atsumiense]|nr:Exonuclease SbcC [Rhodovastum atsumiense]